jgi:ATP-binding cassette subfamily C protein CydD
MNLDPRLLREARTARLWLALTVGLGVLGGITTVLQARTLSRVVSQVFLGGQSLGGVGTLLAALLVIAVARAGLIWASEVTANRAAGQVKADLRTRFLAHVLALGPAYMRSQRSLPGGERSGELVNTAVEGIEALDAYLGQYLPQLALTVLVPVTFLLLVFPLDFVSGLVLLLTAPIIPVFMILIGNLADALTRKQWQSLSRMSAHFLDVLQGLTTLKLLGRAKEQVQVIAEISDRFRDTTLGVLRVAFLSALVQEMVATLSTAVVAVEVGLRLLYGRLAFEQAFFVLILAPEFYLPLRLLGTRFHASVSGVTAARRIFEVLETSVNADRGPWTVSRRLPAVACGLPSAIRFDDVYYAYDEGQRPALNGVSFQIEPGQRVALVGPTGAGKSTVAQLLLRFIEPQRGEIRVNGMSLRDVPASDWRKQIAWVSQNPYLFNVSVAENVRLARPDAARDEIIHAAQQAHAHEFIQALPQGYDTVIGERGARLSGGQAQRLALARAFLKDAPLLILDEATSNLDPETEALLQGATERLMQGRMTLVIAHRLSTVYRADQIVVLDAGRVVEIGTHETLLQRHGLYHRLVNAGRMSDDK